jgi:hypothetical protein
MEAPFVSILMPIRNERPTIAASLGSALATDYPADRLEVLALDGMSDDGTRDVLAALAAEDHRLRLVDNPERRQAFALNRGLGLAHGDIIVRMDAHSVYPADYVGRCVATLIETGADNVGGVCTTVPGADTATGRAIARALSVGFGVGNAAFRIGATGRRRVDTVPFGCWRKETLVRLGGFATDLPCAEDDELNARLRLAGGRILLDPAITASYVARPTLTALAAMLWRYGRDKPRAQHRLGRITTLRQLAPPAFVLALATAVALALIQPALWPLPAALAGLHLAVGTLFARRERRRHGLAVAARLPLVFLVMHGAYGLGYLAGLAALLPALLTAGGPRRERTARR